MDLKLVRRSESEGGALLTKTRLSVGQALRVMKITAIILLSACLTASANGFSQKVTLSAKDAPMETVIQQIKNQTGYSFFYNVDWLEKAKTITIDIKKVAIEKALDIVFKDQPISYKLINSTIVLELKEALLDKEETPLPPPLDLKGRVVNEKGEPVPGVTVTVKGTKNASATNDNGEFSLTGVDRNATLVFTSANMETLEVKVGGKTDFGSIALKTKVTLNEEVTITVNTGYQTLSRERSTGSYSKPNLDIVQNRSTSMNILQRLDGLVPGLTINNSPGSENILVRGLNSINATRSPLYIVDGIPMNDLNSINPQDIADITVLKDATAASIWGSRASNGVIVIVTKKGSSNEGVKVNYDAFVSFQGKPDIDYLPVLNSQQFIQASKDIFDPVTYPWASVTAYNLNGSSGLAPHDMILYNQNRGIISATQASKSLDSLASINNVQQIKDLWYRNAALMNHTVSIAGGGQSHSFYGSLAYTNTQTNRPGDENKTYKVNLRQDFKINQRLQIFLITDLTKATTYVKRNIAINSRFYPYQLFRDGSSNNLSIPYMGYLSDSTRIDYQNRSRISLDLNPLNEVEFGYTKSDATQNRIVGGATIKLIKGLRFEGVYGYIKGNNHTTSFDGEKSFLVRNELVQFTVAATPSVTPVYSLPAKGGRYTVVNSAQRNWTVRNQMVYDNSWNNHKHQLVALAGQEAQEQLSTTNQSTVRGYSELLQTYASVDYATLGTNGVANPVMSNNFGRSVLFNDAFYASEIQTRFTSYYANAAYTFSRKYSINGSWRIDKSNLFGIEKSAQNRPVWSAGGKWMLSDEKFLSSTSWLNRLALRVTYGITGNSPLPGTASSFDILAPRTSNFFPGATGLAIATPGNIRLTWESTKTLNFGIDFNVFKNRLTGTLDLYRKKTTDLIGNLAVNSFTGYSNIIGNFGDLQNNGVEISLNSINIQKTDFVWQTSFTAAYNKNKITKINAASSITTGQSKVQQQYLQGYSAFAVFAYQFAGLDAVGDPTIFLNDKSTTKTRNITKPEDIAFMGTYQPVWSGGLSNMVSYKGLSLSVNAIYNLGHVMRRDVNTFYVGRNVPFGLSFTSGNLHAEFANRWKNPGDEKLTNVPSHVSTTAADSRRDVTYYTQGDINVISASYIKLRDITLEYSLPKQLISHIKAKNVSFRVQLSNIMLWKGNKYGIDPEFQNGFAGTRLPKGNQGAITIGAHVTF